MKIVSNEEVRAFEEKVISGGTSAEGLMRRAAGGIVRALLREYPAAKEAFILVGKGNNGGDGLLVARLLREQGWKVSVGLAFEPSQASPLCAKQLEGLETGRGVDAVYFLTDPAQVSFPWPKADGLVIDALLGVGAKGTLSLLLADLVARINEARERRFFRVVAIDGPTGAHLLAEKGPCVTADLTLTIGFGKEMLFSEAVADKVGRIVPIPIFAGAEETAFPERAEALVPHILRSLAPRRAHSSHKSDHGRILIVGGSRGTAGAPVLSTLGALRTGAGLLHLAVRKDAYPSAAARAPLEAMVLAAGDGSDFTDLLGKVDAIAVGPGLGTDYDASELVRQILTETKVPVILDADALTLAAKDRTLLDACRGRAVLTPHPGEMKRLLGLEKPFALGEREALASRFAEEHGAAVVLKGSRTVVAAPGMPVRINTTGNPGLAAGGSGDLLAGMIAALLGRGLSLRDAASLGVWLHGRAADLAVRERGAEEGLGAVEVAEWIAAAYADLRTSE